jgi:hypothetical protein
MRAGTGGTLWRSSMYFMHDGIDVQDTGAAPPSPCDVPTHDIDRIRCATLGRAGGAARLTTSKDRVSNEFGKKDD